MKNPMSDTSTPTTPFAPLEIVQNAMGAADRSTVAVELPLYRFNGVHVAPGQSVEMTMLAKVTITGAAA